MSTFSLSIEGLSLSGITQKQAMTSLSLLSDAVQQSNLCNVAYVGAFEFQNQRIQTVKNMTTTNYLDLDINKLFQEHTIKEIEEIQKKIQLESDRKKIELRTLVG